jgi:AcrR family transcriptional regulator
LAVTKERRRTAGSRKTAPVQVQPSAVEPGGRASAEPTTRDLIIRAAIELFGKHGYEATATRDIAFSVGIKAASIYNYFRSKEELFAAAVTSVLDDFVDVVLGPVDPTQPSREQLMGVVRRHVLYELSPHSLARTTDLLLEAERLGKYLPEGMSEGIRVSQRRLYETVRDLAAKSAGKRGRDIDRSVRAFAIITICDRVGTWFEPGERLTAEQVAGEIARLVGQMVDASPAI